MEVEARSEDVSTTAYVLFRLALAILVIALFGPVPPVAALLVGLPVGFLAVVARLGTRYAGRLRFDAAGIWRGSKLWIPRRAIRDVWSWSDDETWERHVVVATDATAPIRLRIANADSGKDVVAALELDADVCIAGTTASVRDVARVLPLLALLASYALSYRSSAVGLVAALTALTWTWGVLSKRRVVAARDGITVESAEGGRRFSSYRDVPRLARELRRIRVTAGPAWRLLHGSPKAQALRERARVETAIETHVAEAQAAARDGAEGLDPTSALALEGQGGGFGYRAGRQLTPAELARIVDDPTASDAHRLRAAELLREARPELARVRIETAANETAVPELREKLLRIADDHDDEEPAADAGAGKRTV